MKILKAFKKEFKENWGYAVGAAIAGLIVQQRVEKQTRERIEHEISMKYLYADEFRVVDGIMLDHYMSVTEYMIYLEFKYRNKPNKKKKIQYLKEVGFIN